jgi:regulator of protease activity HflC (stomatin/prohibitin superfamily)
MRQKLTLLIALFTLAFFNSACYKLVEPGSGGIIVNKSGGDRGVEEIAVETGRVWYNPFTESVYEFPHFTQRVVWTANRAEGSPNDESITFNSVEGVVITADVGFAYNIMKSRIPHVFEKLRTDAETITDGYMRSQVRKAIAACAENRVLDVIYGSQKTAVTDCAKKALLEETFIAKNFEVDYVNFVGALRFPKEVDAAINAKIAAENTKKAAIQKAEGEAQAIETVAEARKVAKFKEAEGNERLLESLTPAILAYEDIQVRLQQVGVMKEKWNGELPKAMLAEGQALFNMDITGASASARTASR